MATKKKTTLPKIRIDHETGKRYVKLGKKRVWLSKGVTTKYLLKFLLKQKKKTKKKTKKSTKRKQEVVARTFQENISRSLIGDLIPALSAKALLATQSKPEKPEKIDLDALADKVAKKLPSMAPLGVLDDRLELRKKQHITDKHIPGVGWVDEDVYANLKDKMLHVQEAQENAHRKMADKVSSSERKAQKQAADLRKQVSKSKRKAEIEKLKNELTKAEDAFSQIAHSELQMMADRHKKEKKPFSTKGKIVARLAERYKLGKGTIAKNIIPAAEAIAKDPQRRRIYPTITKAYDKVQALKDNIKELKLARNNSAEQSSSEDSRDAYGGEEEEEDRKVSSQYRGLVREPVRLENLITAEDVMYQRSPTPPTPIARRTRSASALAPGELDVESYRTFHESDRGRSAFAEARQAFDAAAEAHSMRGRSSSIGSEFGERQARLAAEQAEHEERTTRERLEAEIAQRMERDEINERAKNEQARLERLAYEMREEGHNADDVNRVLAEQLEELENVRQSQIREAEQGGKGRGSSRGLSTNQINNIMSDYRDYRGCIAIDEIHTLRIRPGIRFGFVMNTDPSTKSGTHWVAIYVDGRPDGSHTIEFYNSLADQPTSRILKVLSQLEDIMRTKLRLKVNKIADQSNDSANCGYFATKFLIDRFKGKSFAEASGYNAQYEAGEKRIEAWKEQSGHGDVEQTGEGIRDVIRNGVAFVKKRYQEVMSGIRHHASPSVRKWLEKFGDEEIVQKKICRKPIFSAIEKVADALSQGRWEKNKADLAYDKMFHLFILVKLFNGKVAKIEKNHVVEITSASWETGQDTEEMPFAVTTDMTVKKCLEYGEKAVGASKLFVYDARTQNCQFFIQWLLQHTYGWNTKVESFVMQNTEKVLEGLGLLGKIAKVATDVAHVADVAMNGRGEHLLPPLPRR